MRIKKNIYLLLLLLGIFAQGCKVTYSFTGASISPETKTFSVQYFPNRANIVVPTLSQQLTDALRQKFQAQTSLKLVQGMGDVDFDGEITGYETRPEAIQANETAALNRLTITIRVKYTNTIDPDKSFDKTFSRFETYSSTESLQSVEGELIKKILDQLTDDVFNAAFVNW